jgi:hypothetical protein
MDMVGTHELVEAERVSGSLAIAFSDGAAGFYTAQLFREMLRAAKQSAGTYPEC